MYRILSILFNKTLYTGDKAVLHVRHGISVRHGRHRYGRRHQRSLHHRRNHHHGCRHRRNCCRNCCVRECYRKNRSGRNVKANCSSTSCDCREKELYRWNCCVHHGRAPCSDRPTKWGVRRKQSLCRHRHDLHARDNLYRAKLKRNYVRRDKKDHCAPNRDGVRHWLTHCHQDDKDAEVPQAPSRGANRAPIHDASLNGSGPNPSPSRTNCTSRG